jgi:hypothetical protein
MTHTTHTQGEWAALEAGRELPGTEGCHEIHSYVAHQLVMIAEISWGNFSTHCPDGTPQIPDYEITEAEALNNAHLIAAAPDLLEALKGILGALDQPVTRRLRAEHSIFNGDMLVIEHFALAAINKARGIS